MSAAAALYSLFLHQSGDGPLCDESLSSRILSSPLAGIRWLAAAALAAAMVAGCAVSGAGTG